MLMVERTQANGEEGHLTMYFDLIVGLFVQHPDQYAHYRAEMTPLLDAAGGRFTYDFEVAKTLKSDAGHEINRVFIIRFPDRSAKEQFFASPSYREIRSRLFDGAVRGTTVLGECAG